MDVKLLLPFIEGAKVLLEQFGVTDVTKGRLEKKPVLTQGNNVNVIIGFRKDLAGSVIYSMSFSTAKNIVSVMMGGMAVEEYDEAVKSGICEFANMVSGYTVASFYKTGMQLENTPPTLVSGNKLLMLSKIETIMVELITPMGSVEVNIGIEQ